MQHAEKLRHDGDPGLTERGRQQAVITAEYISAGNDVVAVYTSDLRRAVETARPIAEACALPLLIDERLTERMNWTTAIWPRMEDFIEDWDRASVDRHYQPKGGESSAAAAARMLAFLDEVRQSGSKGRFVAVSHGGVTVDLLRTLMGDTEVASRHPDLVREGPPPAGITTLETVGQNWRVTAIGDLHHLTSHRRPTH